MYSLVVILWQNEPAGVVYYRKLNVKFFVSTAAATDHSFYEAELSSNKLTSVARFDLS